MPNERDGISVIAFSFTEMCKGVNGDDPAFINRSINYRASCIATNKPLAARYFTHTIVGELSLNNATYAARNVVQTFSIIIHNINDPDISKS